MKARVKLTDEEFAEACATYEELGKKIFADFAHRTAEKDSSRIYRITRIMSSLPESVVGYSAGLFDDPRGIEIALEDMKRQMILKASVVRRMLREDVATKGPMQ